MIPKTYADVWATSAEHAEPESVYFERWKTVRLILETGCDPISPEEVATWRPRPSRIITLLDVVTASYACE